MEEQTISFKTSKLLKNKNFNEKVDFQFDKTGYKNRSCYDIEVVIGPYDKKEFTKVNHYPAPTQSLLQKWLREIHKIIVLVDWEGTDGYFYKLDFKSFYEVAGNNNKNYEDCLELGLQEALKLI